MPSGSSTLFQLRLAILCSADFTCAGNAPGGWPYRGAAAPATCGLAIEVPLSVRYPPPK